MDKQVRRAEVVPPRRTARSHHAGVGRGSAYPLTPCRVEYQGEVLQRYCDILPAMRRLSQYPIGAQLVRESDGRKLAWVCPPEWLPTVPGRAWDAGWGQDFRSAP